MIQRLLALLEDLNRQQWYDLSLDAVEIAHRFSSSFEILIAMSDVELFLDLLGGLFAVDERQRKAAQRASVDVDDRTSVGIVQPKRI